MRIVDLNPTDDTRVAQVARLVVAAFAGWPGTWATFAEALAEVRASFGAGRLSLVALDEADDPLGWIGAQTGYRGRAGELPPVAVRPDAQRRSVGRALVTALEERLRA